VIESDHQVQSQRDYLPALDLVAGLRVVFATFTKDVGANVQGSALLLRLDLLHLDNIANLEWYYNNTLNKLTKADKSNIT
jgi:hypothetical protein